MSGLCSETVAAYNADREDALAQRRQIYGHVAILAAFFVLAFGLGAVLLLKAVYLNSVLTHLMLTAIMVCACGLIPLYGIVRRWIDKPARALQTSMREIVFPAIFHEIAKLRFRSEAEGFAKEVPDALRSHWKLSAFGLGREKLRYEWGDLIEGWYGNYPIAISELKVTQRVRRGKYYRTETAFQGVTLKFGLAQPVPAISISRADGTMSTVMTYLGGRASPGKNIRPFDLERDVECSDSAFAAAVFSEEGLRRFSQLQSTHAKGDLRFAARQSTGYLLVETSKDLFELPPLDKPLDEVADVRRLRGEMSGLLELISDMREMVEIDPSQTANPNAPRETVDLFNDAGRPNIARG